MATALDEDLNISLDDDRDIPHVSEPTYIL